MLLAETMILLEIIFVLIVALILLPVSLLVLQVLVSLFPYRKKNLAKQLRPSIAVLIPAHNESDSMIPTLKSVWAQLTDQDRMIVIADNCSDNTADIAADNRAEVIERFDDNYRGKGYALDFGMRHLERQSSQPDVVIIIDADCLLQANALETLALAAMQRQRPVQSLYLMASPPGAGLKTKIAEFAWVVKNWSRALGYMRLGLPCQLMGTGMAFVWEQIRSADLASGHIVEDLKLGLDFAEQRLAPSFCPEAEVSSVFPLNKEGMNSQRTRWEHGHLGVIVKEGPKLILHSARSHNMGMLALALDMCVPPLALLMLSVVFLAVLATVIIAVSGSLLPWISAFAPMLLLGISILLAWFRFGRHILSLSDLAYAPVYALLKIPVYLKFLVKRQVEWVRSHRD